MPLPHVRLMRLANPSAMPSRSATRAKVRRANHAIRAMAGHTLVELMVATTILAIATGGIYSAYLTQAKAYMREQQIVEAQQTLRLAETIMGRDLQRAGYNPARAGFSGLTYHPTQLLILADLNGDGMTVGPNENITYTYDAGQLRLFRTSGTVQMEFPHIESFTLSYMDGGGNPTTISSDIRQVRLSITARTAQPDPGYPLNNGYRTFTLDFRVTPRNLAL